MFWQEDDTLFSLAPCWGCQKHDIQNIFPSRRFCSLTIFPFCRVVQCRSMSASSRPCLSILRDTVLGFSVPSVFILASTQNKTHVPFILWGFLFSKDVQGRRHDQNGSHNTASRRFALSCRASLCSADRKRRNFLFSRGFLVFGAVGEMVGAECQRNSVMQGADTQMCCLEHISKPPNHAAPTSGGKKLLRCGRRC